jgi:hypothetical protein
LFAGFAAAAQIYAHAARVGQQAAPAIAAAKPRGICPGCSSCLLASCAAGQYRGQARRALIFALKSLAGTLADLRTAREQRLQSAAATRRQPGRRCSGHRAGTGSALSRRRFPRSARYRWPRSGSPAGTTRS